MKTGGEKKSVFNNIQHFPGLLGLKKKADYKGSTNLFLRVLT